MNDETIKQQEELPVIVNKIIDHRNKEISIATRNVAIGTVKVILDGKEKYYWLTDTDAKNTHANDFVGNAIPGTRINIFTPADINTFYKHGKFGMFLNSLRDEKHEFVSNKVKTIFGFNHRTTYNPSNQDFARDVRIEFSGTERTYSSNTITELLQILDSINQDEAKLKKAQQENDAEEEKRLNARLVEKIKLREELLSVKHFIRTAASLRYQPTLDPIQDKVKSSKIFNGHLIINGGPGTGKTTSLIQRIKFLTSSTIEEFVVVPKDKTEILFDQTKNWQFFTPNNLLALFLRTSMREEKLIASDQTVRVWEDYKLVLFKEYSLTDYDTKRPFILYKKNNESFLPNSYDGLNELIISFEKFFLNQFEIRFNRILGINTSAFSWNNIAERMRRALKDFNSDSIVELLRLYFNLNMQFVSSSQEITAGFNDLIHQEATKLSVLLKKEKLRYKEVVDILASLNEPVEDDDDDESEEATKKNEDEIIDYEEKIHNILKILIRKSGLVLYDPSTKISTRDNKFLALLPEIKDLESLQKIGQIAFYKKYFERLSTGVVPNIYREIPIVYKKFRKAESTRTALKWNKTLLKILVEKDNNTRLHTNEVSFLLLFINNLNKKFARNFPVPYRQASHSYIDAFKNVNRAVIGIDEATDFSLVDLMTMSSLNHPAFDSVTLSGDMMQKITTEGLEKWEDYIKMYNGTEIYNLETSYRQSSTLLELAKGLYKKINNETASYKSFLPFSSSEPKPLLLVSDDEENKMEWIAKRILEIYNVYKKNLLITKIPSIAIFLSDESLLDKFASELANYEEISDVGIKVKACRNGDVLGDPDTVRVFSVDKIKGLEFEAAFFHNADSILNAGNSADIFYKYLYVGLSRASFYLAMTLKEPLQTEIEFLADNFSTDRNWK